MLGGGYQWFSCADALGNDAKEIEGAVSQSYETQVFSQEEIKFYYCQTDKGTKSKIFAVAYTGLPTLYINTKGVNLSSITKKDYVPIDFNLVMSDGTKIEKQLTKKGLKGRGNSTWAFPKKGYNLNFDSKEAFFNLPKSKKWCLIANYSDKSLIRNKFASALCDNVYASDWSPHYISIDLVVNNEYLGNYIFCEKNSIQEGRIDIKDISKCDESKLDEGGFLLEIDMHLTEPYYEPSDELNFYSSKGIPFVLKDPDEVSETTKQYITMVINKTEEVLYGDSFCDLENGWRKYIDENSLIDWYIINEFAKNVDAGREFATSVYLYYNPSDKKLHFGPVWDFDIGFGNCGFSLNSLSSVCSDVRNWYVKDMVWLSRLFNDSSFVANIKTRWNETKSKLNSEINNTIQKYADDNRISANCNYMKWQILGRWVIPAGWKPVPGYKSRTTYQSEVDYMIDWCNKRYNWIDSEINKL